MLVTQEIDLRFITKLDLAPGGEAGPCLLWTASTDRGGYGAFALTSRQQVPAHKYAWMRFHAWSDWPQDTHGRPIHLRRNCPHRRCVSPWHMRLKPLTNSIEEFWERIAVGLPDECWEWIERTNDDGYGLFDINGTRHRAHRLAWEVTNGPIPEGLFACHRCDNPPCCNPSHLFLGTAEENFDDMRAKGRHYRLLSDGDVAELRRRRADGELLRSIAEHFGISTPYASHVATGRSRSAITTDIQTTERVTASTPQLTHTQPV